MISLPDINVSVDDLPGTRREIGGLEYLLTKMGPICPCCCMVSMLTYAYPAEGTMQFTPYHADRCAQLQQEPDDATT